MNLVFVGMGGFIGSALRYLVSGLVYDLTSDNVFPFHTLVINTIGCLVIGILNGVAETRHFFGPEARAFLFVGLLGGFTTFSTFGYETFALASDGEAMTALLNGGLQLTIGLGAVWLGYSLARLT